MVCDPSPHPDADRSNFRFTERRIDPQADAPFDSIGVDAERGERIGDPLFERMYEPPYVAAALFQIEHDIADPQIGRASCRERVVSTCRSRWSPYPYKKKKQKTKK